MLCLDSAQGPAPRKFGEDTWRCFDLVVTAERAQLAVILIVEDDVFICQMAELMMRDWGYQTLSASDVNEALVILRSPEHIDALFTDIYLKNDVLGGCDLAQQAVQLRPELRVLYTTGNFVTETMKALFVRGARFLCKPYAEDQLQDSVERLLAA